MRLFDFLFPPRVDEAALRDVTADDFLALLAPRLVPATRPSAVALLPFSDARVRAAIHEAKYHGSEQAFTYLSVALIDYLTDADERLSKSRIVPIPLGAERLKERGFNQIEEVAKRAVQALRIPVEASLLLRVHETASQVSLPRHEREKNMRGAFRTTRPADPSCAYILIDDVLTTGATLQAAIDALRDAGAVHIIPLALAH